jgi:hypothetical protein
MEPLASYQSDSGDRQRLYSIGLGFLCVVGMIAWAILGEDTSVRPARSDDNANAYVFSAEFVKRQLTSPSAAGFCAFDKTKIALTGTDTWTVAGCVEEAGASGALLRRDYICKLHKRGHLWHLDGISLAPG